jgi:hypothetical protein
MTTEEERRNMFNNATLLVGTMADIYWKALSLSLVISIILTSSIAFLLLTFGVIGDPYEIIHAFMQPRTSVTFAQASEPGLPIYLSLSSILLIGLGILTLSTLALYMALSRAIKEHN